MRDKRTPKDVCGEATLTEDMAQATFEFNYENEAQSFHTPQALFTSLMEDKPRLPDSPSAITQKYIPSKK